MVFLICQGFLSANISPFLHLGHLQASNCSALAFSFPVLAAISLLFIFWTVNMIIVFWYNKLFPEFIGCAVLRLFKKTVEVRVILEIEIESYFSNGHISIGQ